MDFVMVPFHFTPPVSFEAINKDGLINAGGAFNEMPVGFGIKSNISWQQVTQKAMFQGRRDHPSWQNRDTLAGESFRFTFHACSASLLAEYCLLNSVHNDLVYSKNFAATSDKNRLRAFQSADYPCESSFSPYLNKPWHHTMNY